MYIRFQNKYSYLWALTLFKSSQHFHTCSAKGGVLYREAAVLA